MAVTPLEVVVPALAGIITAAGTILSFRWQEETKRKKDERENQIALWNKVDEIVDERVAEIRADRDEMKSQLKVGEQERKRLADEQSKLKQGNAILRSQISEIQLQREQAINRMRRELSGLAEKNTILLAEKTELQMQLEVIQRENQELRQELNTHVQQQSH